MNFLIVGAGLTGAVIARTLAERGLHSLVIDEDDHVAGNCHTQRDPATGVLVHRYGPHTLHSDNDRVWDFIQRFAQIHPYAHRKQAWVQGRLYPFPINLTAINLFFGTRLAPHEAADFLKVQARPYWVESPRNFEEAALATIGRRLYDGFYAGYTRKQWGREPATLPAFVFQRLPVHLRDDSNVFHHKRQGQPVGGYTQMVERMLQHENITVRLNCAYVPALRDGTYDHVFYSGPIDRYFDYCLGRLPYRTLEFAYETRAGTFQECGTVNYCDESVPYTRIAEHKHFWPWESTGGQTLITYEYSRECGPDDKPYYPIHLSDGNALYRKYVDRARVEHATSFVGRLGTYRYLDMERAIDEAIQAAQGTLDCLEAARPIPAFFVPEYSSH